MKTKTVLIFTFITLFFSCSEGAFYSKFDSDFADNQWQKTDVKAYEFNINDETKFYDVIFRFSHIYDYQFAQVPIDIKITDSIGKEEKFTIDLKIKEDSGKELGDCAGDICDLNFKIKDKIKLSKGNYKISISNSFDRPYLPNVLGVGLEVKMVK